MTLHDEYSAVSQSAVVGSIAVRGQIAVTGRDRASYLQGLLTNDIPALVPGSGCYAAWLSPQGRMLTDLHLFESGTMLLLDVPGGLVQATLDRLEQFIFSEDVQTGSLAGSLVSLSVHGPRAATVLEAVLAGAGGLGAWNAYQHAQATFGGQPAVVARVDQVGVPGFHVYLEPAHEAALRDALAAGGAVAVGEGALTAARIEAGYPVFGLDMTEDTIPLEAGIESRAISMAKGCYVGQEVIVRVLHRGHGRVARRLVGLRVDGAVPETGARLRVGSDGDAKEIGFVTSAADSPRLGGIALGYVHRDFVAPGTVVWVVTAAGVRSAAVSALPMTSAA
jgi:folate-binding protein YgfZ